MVCVYLYDKLLHIVNFYAWIIWVLIVPFFGLSEDHELDSVILFI